MNMENQRFILFFALMVVMFLMWEAWQQDYNPQQNVVETATVATDSDLPLNDGPVVANATIAESPADLPSDQQTIKTEATSLSVPEAPAKESLQTSQRIHITTDLFNVVVDTRGGDIREVDLLDYPVSSDQPDVPFELMKDTRPNLFVAQSGLRSDNDAPNHYAVFSAEKSDYSMAEGQNELRVPLQWQSESGVKVTKTLIFKRGTHTIDVEQRVENGSGEEWRGRQYRQLQRTRPDGSGESMFLVTYTGGVIYSEEEHYEKIKFDDMEDKNLSRDIKGGWAAIIQHYFLAAMVPTSDETNHYYSMAPEKDRFVLGMVSPTKTIAPGQAESFTSRFYIGPKAQSALKEISTGLDLTVDYGMLTVIAKPLFWLLGIFHGMIGNWGWAIILVTLMIKLAFFPLSAASYKSMANMRKFAPKMQQLKERYGDDRQRMSQAMMELYKKEKINPLSGCLPMLVQIPVFIALYWVLLESVELRQAPFIGWIQDLSIKDPYYVLPLLMGASMLVQQKLNPPPPDPVQAKVMMFLPIIFTGFFAFFPAGLVLYWLANSILSVAQQWYITRKIEKAGASTPPNK